MDCFAFNLESAIQKNFYGDWNIGYLQESVQLNELRNC
jgi:hypothetical protein